MSLIRKQMAEDHIKEVQASFDRSFPNHNCKVPNIVKAQIHKYYAGLEKDAQKQIQEEQDLQENGLPGLYDLLEEG